MEGELERVARETGREVFEERGQDAERQRAIYRLTDSEA